MYIDFVRSFASIKEAPASSEFELSDFIVLSGPNGSGKSNLLEAIFNQSSMIRGIQYNDDGVYKVKIFRLGELLATGGQEMQLNQISERWVELHNLQQEIMRHMANVGTDGMPSVKNQIASRGHSITMLQRYEDESGKTL